MIYGMLIVLMLSCIIIKFQNSENIPHVPDYVNVIRSLVGIAAMLTFTTSLCALIGLLIRGA